jgi:3-deoxy-D-manno-octulosonic acid kinase
VSGVRAVVRHNWHGGLLAPLTRDLFLPPTRAPHEMLIARQLHAAGVNTPDVLMIGVTSAFVGLQRADVVTREIVGGRDLSTYMQPTEPSETRALAWTAARALVQSLNAAGARHHDLNVKNVLLEPAHDGLVAWVLDVDRVVFGEPNAREVRQGNAARLLRSARKWRDERGAVFGESELAALD